MTQIDWVQDPTLSGSNYVGGVLTVDPGQLSQESTLVVVWEEWATYPGDVAVVATYEMEGLVATGTIQEPQKPRVEGTVATVANYPMEALPATATGGLVSLPTPAVVEPPLVSVTHDALVTARYKRLLRVDFLMDGELIGGTHGTDQLVKITGGSVVIERNSISRRSLNMSLEGTLGDIISGRLRDYDSLDGMQIVVHMGLQTDFGQEWHRAGLFFPDETIHSQTKQNYNIALKALDRSFVINNAERETVLTIPRGTGAAEAFMLFIRAHYPEAIFLIDNLEGTTPLAVSMNFSSNADNWSEAQRLAQAFGCETFVDAYDRIVLRKVPDPRTAPVRAQYSDVDRTHYPFVNDPVVRTINMKEVYNGVIVRAEAPWLLFPIVGKVWDTNPASPTYYDPANPDASKLGPRPLRIGDSYVGSVAAAQAAAQSKFNEIVGMNEVISFSAMPDPRIEAGDVYMLDAQSVGLNDRMVVDTAELSFDVRTPMNVKGRKVS